MSDGNAARPLRPGLFLDRDGVINVDTNFLYRPEECRLIDGIAGLVHTANQLGYVTCVITNQSGIGRGLFTEADFHRLMEYMSLKLLEQDARLDAVYFSPYHPLHGVGHYMRESDCRKPAPGMLLRAAEEHGIDLARSVLVGDRCTDLEAGNAAGVPKLFLFGNTESSCSASNVPYTMANTLFTVQAYLVATRND
jgi:D-glycero-D-manno-heptose 1,7-bisphosphate phosphatase